MKIIIVSIALMVYWVSCAPTDGTTRTPFVKLSCKGHHPDGFFVDASDPAVFHQCSHGQHIATFHCQNSTIFNETAQVCVTKRTVSVHCPKADGLFPYPGNPHKFIACNMGNAFVEACAADLIFDETHQECVYNDKGLTWETDVPVTRPPTTPLPVKETTLAPTHQTTEAPIRESTAHPAPRTNETPIHPTTAPEVLRTVGTECIVKGNTADPENIHKYFICHNGKKLHQTCPEGSEFDPVIKACS